MVSRQKINTKKAEHLAFLHFELQAMAHHADSNPDDHWGGIYRTWIGDDGSQARTILRELVKYIEQRLNKILGQYDAVRVDIEHMRRYWLKKYPSETIGDLRIVIYRHVYASYMEQTPGAHGNFPRCYLNTEGASAREASNMKGGRAIEGVATLSSNTQTLTGTNQTSADYNKTERTTTKDIVTSSMIQ